MRLSSAPAAHGGALFRLYACDASAFQERATRHQPLGQILVKECWESESEPGDLLIMIRLPAGWSYGRATHDGRRVVEAGRLKSCRACHDAAPDGIIELR